MVVVSTNELTSSTKDLRGGAAPGVSILVVDEEPGVRDFLKKALDKHCALVEVAESVDTAEALRQRCHFDLLIVDVSLPGRAGLEWLRSLREREIHTDVIVMTADADLDTAIPALRAGAADFIAKPFGLEEIMTSVRRCLERRRMAREKFLLPRNVLYTALKGIVGSSPAMREICEVVERVAAAASIVLIEGETGTGKELVARAIHGLSGRSGPFVPVNCGSISPDLLESELFGHTKGAFTGTHSAREGLFAYAQGGTLFLDEIAEMPLAMQAKLLRALESRAVRPVGADREVPVDARVIAATNRRLIEEVNRGSFREDLYFRLNVLTITVPPLRERPDDIPALVEALSASLSKELGLPVAPLTHQDVVKLQSYPWPGNVRELKNVLERSLLLGKLPSDCCNEPQTARSELLGAPLEFPLGWTLAEVEKAHMLRVLESAGGNKSLAARHLGVSRKTLERKLKTWEVGG